MIDFERYPKQWLISEAANIETISGHADEFEGFHVHAAKDVPILRLTNTDGTDLGRLIGWVIHDNRLISESTQISLSLGEALDQFYRDLSGRFVLLWRDGIGNILFREDSSGGFPAVFSAAQRVIASTVSVMDHIVPLEEYTEVDEIFQFPHKRGFLPFGLTSKRGVVRLMPNHVLETKQFSVRRVWPTDEFLFAALERPQDARTLTEQASEKVKRNTTSILEHGKAVLNLSGGHDSRMVLAACKGQENQLRCVTFGESDELNVHVGEKVARAGGFEHKRVSVVPTPRADIIAWLHRTGYSMYDPVTELAATVEANHSAGEFQVSGTGAELARATNWKRADIGLKGLDIDTLLKRIRVPDVPVVRRAGQVWLDGIPKAADAATILDLAKIEQIHGCWAGSAVYGHKIELPSLYPFSGQWWNEVALSLPQKGRSEGRFFRDFVEMLWPEMARIPVNKAAGINRLRFWKQELKDLMPAKLKRWLRPMR